MGANSDWVPAFQGQRPPFQPGHELSTKHGAYSIRKLTPVAQGIAEAVLSEPGCSYLQEPRYRAAVEAWAMAEARVVLLEQWIGEMEIEQAASAKPGAAPPLELLRRWESTAMTHRSRLGLDPASAARLGRDVAAAQADIVAVLTKARSDLDQAGDAL